MSPGPRESVVVYPGGLRVRYRWGGSGEAAAVFALSEAGGPVTPDLGPNVAAEPDVLCRAEVRVDGPAGGWTVRLASLTYDEPAGLAWDTAGLLVIKYGFAAYGFAARTGTLAWLHRTKSPLMAVLGSSRLPHVIAVAEVECVALLADGSIAWRSALSDVVVGAELVGGQLVLMSYGGQTAVLDPATGRMRG